MVFGACFFDKQHETLIANNPDAMEEMNLQVSQDGAR
jgi:hypothetical protein